MFKILKILQIYLNCKEICDSINFSIKNHSKLHYSVFSIFLEFLVKVKKLSYASEEMKKLHSKKTSSENCYFKVSKVATQMTEQKVLKIFT